MSLGASSELPVLHGPRIRLSVRPKKSIRIGNLREVIEHLHDEKVQYAGTMKILVKNIDAVNVQNQALQNGIMERRQVKQEMLKEVALETQRLKKAVDSRHRANKRLKDFEGQHRNVRKYESTEQIEKALAAIIDEIKTLSEQREVASKDRLDAEQNVRKTLALNQVTQQLLDMNKTFVKQATHEVTGLTHHEQQLDRNEKKRLAVVKQKLLRAEKLRKELDLNDEQLKTDMKPLVHACRSVQRGANVSYVLDRVLDDVSKPLEEWDSCYSETDISRPHSMYSVREPAEGSPDRRRRSCRSSRSQMDSDLDESISAILEKNKSILARADAEDGCLRHEVIEEEDELDLNDVAERMQLSDPSKEVDMADILTNSPFYERKFPEIDEQTIKIKKHREQKEAKKRRSRIEYEEHVNRHGVVEFTRKDKEYDLVKQESDGGTVHKYKIPKPYEYFEVEVEHGVRRVRRKKEYELVEDNSDGGTPYIFKSLMKFKLEKDGKKWVRKVDEENEYEYDDDGSGKLQKKRKVFGYVDVESEGGTIRKVKKAINNEEYEYDEVENAKGEHEIIKRKKEFETREEKKNGKKRVIRKAVERDVCFEYDEVDDDEGSKIVKRQLEFEVVDVESEGGTIRKVRRQVEDPDAYIFERSVNEKGEVEVLRKKRPYEWKEVTETNGAKRMIKKLPKVDEYEYDEITDENTGQTKIEKTKKGYQTMEIVENGVTKQIKVPKSGHSEEYEMEWTLNEKNEFVVMKRKKEFEVHEVNGKQVSRPIEHKAKIVYERIGEGGETQTETSQLKYETRQMECEGGMKVDVHWPLFEKETRKVEVVNDKGKTETVEQPVEFTCEWSSDKTAIIRREIAPESWEYDEVEEEDGKISIRKKRITLAKEKEGEAGYVWKAKRNEEDEYDFVDVDGKIERRKKVFEYVDVKCDDGTIRKVRRGVKQDDDYELVEVIDEDGKHCVVRREKSYEYNEITEGGTKRRVKKEVHADEYEYDEVVDHQTGEKKLVRRKVLFEPTEQLSEGGTKRTVRSRIEPDEYEYEEVVNERTGKTKMRRRLKQFEFVRKDGKVIRRLLPGDNEYEYEEVVDEKTGEKTMMRRRKQYTWVTIDGKLVKRRLHGDDEYEYEEVIDEETGVKTLQRKRKKYMYVKINGKRVKKNVHRDDEYEYEEVIDEETGERSMQRKRKCYEYVRVNGKLVKRQIHRDDEYEYEEVVDEETGERTMKRRPKTYEYVTVNGKRIKRQIHGDDEYEYEEVVDEETGERTIQRKHKQYEYVMINGKRVKKKIHGDDEYEYEEVLDEETGEKVVRRKHKQYEYVTINGKQVRRIVHGDDEYEYEEVIDEETGEPKLQRKRKEYEYVMINGKSVKREVVNDGDYEYDEDEDGNVIKKRYEVITVMGEDGKPRQIKRVIVVEEEEEEDFEYEYEYVMQTNPDGTQEIVKQRRRFRMVEEESEGGTVHLVKRWINYDDEYDYEEVIDEHGNKTYVRKLKEYEIIEMVDENGNTIQVRKPVSYAMDEVVQEDGTVIKVRRERKPKKRVKRLVRRFVTQWPIDEHGNVIRPRKRKHTIIHGDQQLQRTPSMSNISRELISMETIENRRKLTAQASNPLFVFGAILDNKSGCSPEFEQQLTSRQNCVRRRSPSFEGARQGTEESKPSPLTAEALARLNAENPEEPKLGEDDAFSYYSYDDPDDFFEKDDDNSYRPLCDNKAFARKLLADAIQRQVNRKNMEIDLHDRQCEVEKLTHDKETLRHNIEVRMLEKAASKQEKRIENGIVAIYIPPTIRKPKLTQSDGQTEMSNDDVNNISLEITECSKIASERGVEERIMRERRGKATALKMKYDDIQARNTELGQHVHALDSRYRIVRPQEGDSGLHPETERRIKLEQTIDQRHKELTTIAKKKEEDVALSRKLKCKIEDQHIVHDMLNKKIAERRRMERPNVTALVRDMDSIKRTEKQARERLKLLSIEESSLDKEYHQIRQRISSTLAMKQGLERTREEIAALKKKVLGTLKLQSTRPFHLTCTSEIQQLERTDRRLNSDIQDKSREIESLQEQVSQITRGLSGHKLRVPANFMFNKI